MAEKLDQKLSQRREEKITAVLAAELSKSALQTEDEDIVLENVPALDAYNNNNNTYTLLNTITNNPLVLKHGLKDLLDWVKDSYIERDINLVYKFIFDTGASVHVISNKSWFTSYKEINTTVKWGEAKTLLVRGEGTCKITFTDTGKEATLRKCFYIPELGINIIGATALPPDIL